LVRKRKMAALRVLSGIEIVGEFADLHHLTELRKLTIYRLGIKKGSKAFEDLRSSIEYLGGFSLHTLVIYDESSRFLRSLDALASSPKFFIALELCGKMVKLPRWITELDVLSKLTLSVTLLKEGNLKELSKLKALFSLTFTSSATKQDQKTVTIIEKNRPGPKGLIIIPADGFEKLKLLRFSASYLPLLSFSPKAMPGLERLELRFSMLEGLLGTENLKSLSEVHVSLQMRKQVEPKTEMENVIDVGHIKKRIEDDIPKRIEDDIPSVKTSSGMKPKIIFNQYND
jgi:hypothetical protein